MCFRIEFPLSAYVQPIPLLQPLHFHGCIWVKELELPRATHGPPSSYTRAPGMRGGSPAAAGVAAAAFSLTPTFTPTFAGASSADLVLVLVQAVEERAAARRAAEAAAAARDAAKCALQQQLDQVCRGSSRISGAHCVECAAARSAVTAQRATSRGRASARCTSCHAHPPMAASSTPQPRRAAAAMG